MITIQQPKQVSNKMILTTDISKSAGKLGRHNLSFKTGVMKDRKKEARKNACRKKGRNQEW